MSGNLYYSGVYPHVRRELIARGQAGSINRTTRDISYMVEKIANVEIRAYDNKPNKDSKPINVLGGKTVIGLGASISGPIFPSRVRDPFGMVAVSTIEPRKCYEDILDTFDILRAFGYPITLDIVGRHGWGQEAIANRIRSHEEFGKSLVWHSNCDDKELTEIYKRTSISIVASKNEGWGLSIEEGIRHGHKVIARDIEIFRSRNNPNIYFFDNNSQPMADTIIHAVEKEFIGMHNQRTMMDFSKELLNLMISMR